jgi:hypothetical protein
MSLSYKNLELECHCLTKTWSWNVIVLEKFGAEMSLAYTNLELECHWLIKNDIPAQNFCKTMTFQLKIFTRQ